MIDGADVYCATGIQRLRAVTMRKYDLLRSSGEAARHLNEVDNKHCISRTFPLSSLAEMKAFAELFMLQDHIQWGVNETPDESGLLHEFFLPNAIRPTTLTTLEYNEEGQRSHWIHKPALNFYAVLKASDVKNMGLVKDKHDVRATRLGPEYVSVSVTYPMSTSADKCNFSRSIMGCALADFMHPHSRIYLTNWVVAVNQPPPQQAAEQMAETEEEVEAREAADDEEADDEEADDFGAADSDNGRAVESESDEEEEDDDDEADGDNPNQAARNAVRELSNTLFEHKEGMSEQAYVQLSNALKRTHEQMS